MLTFVSMWLGIVGVAAGAALLGLYFFKNRQRRTEVSSLFLWNAAANVRDGGRALRPARLPWLFYLELAMLAMLAIALLRPAIMHKDSRPKMALILDNSASMDALDCINGAVDPASRSARQRAIKTAAKLARDPRWRECAVIVAGNAPRLFTDWPSAAAKWSCDAPSFDLAAALAMARNAMGSDAQIIVISDTPPGDVEASDAAVKYYAFGKAAPNVGIVSAFRGADLRGKEGCLLGVANFPLATNDAASAKIKVLESVGDETVSWDVEVGSGGIEYVFRPSVGERAMEFRIDNELAQSFNALAADDVAMLVPAPSRKVRYYNGMASGEARDFVNKAIESTGLAIDVAQGADESAGEGAADRAVFAIWDYSERDRRPTTGARWNLFVKATGRNPIGVVGPFLLDQNSEIVSGISMAGAIWGVFDDGESLDGEPIIQTAERTILSANETFDGGKELLMQFDVAHSFIQRTPDWPALFFNILQLRAKDMPPGIENYNIKTGAPLKYGSDDVFVADRPGLHVITYAGVEFTVAANFCSPSESDLSRLATGEWGGFAAAQKAASTSSDISWVFLLLAIILISAHVILTRPRLTAQTWSGP